MFCNQCEQTAKGTGCTVKGVCGKTEEVAALQDLLVYAILGLSLYAHEGRKRGLVYPRVNELTVKGLFSTLTNVNFHGHRFQGMIEEIIALTKTFQEKLSAVGDKGQFDHPAAQLELAHDLEGLIRQGQGVGLASNPKASADIQSLQQTFLYGMKGIAAYTDHAQLLGYEDDRIYAFMHEGFSALTYEQLGLDDWIDLLFRCGETNLLAMELLDTAHTQTFGHPVPTHVTLGHKRGKCILVSGHDLKDLKELLQQTEGQDITIYTHGEMLPAHGYPELKKYEHLYGHYGTAWQNQRKEFEAFPGPILMTTNCIQHPKESYFDHIFTTGLVGWPGVLHLEGGDFQPVLERAQALPGFKEDQERGQIMVGFGHNAVVGVADKVIDAVKSSHIRHFFLVAGCDGAKPGRNYYTEFVERVPGDCVVLTLACGKFRFFEEDLGSIGGIPGLLDIGQCNDAYSAIKIAVFLADAFNCDVNQLPLSMVLSWYEQKAVAILLTLLHLGIKDIRLGPSLPAFITENVLDVLVKNFNIMPIKTPEEDLAAILQ